MRKYKIVNKTRFTLFILSVIALTFIFTYFIKSVYANEKSKESISLTPVYVESGDTLWQLSKKYNRDSDIRSYIENVIHINKLHSANIIPGQLIYFPETGMN